MVIDMNESKLATIEQIRQFLTGTADVAFTVPADETKRRDFVVAVLKRFPYFRLAKKQRGVLLAYLQRVTGYSRQQLSRLLAQYRHSKSLRLHKRVSGTSFTSKYGPAEVRLLAELDSLHDTLFGPATKVLAQRAYLRFGDARYARLAGISVSHLYNLRALSQAAPHLAQDSALADHHRAARRGLASSRKLTRTAADDPIRRTGTVAVSCRSGLRTAWHGSAAALPGTNAF